MEQDKILLWDADKEGKVTLRVSLTCAPPGHLGYTGIGRGGGEGGNKRKGSAQQDETMWDAGEEGKVTLRGSPACAPSLGHRGYKTIGRVGGKIKKKETGRAQQDETLWDADNEGKDTLRGSLTCAPPLGHRGYKSIGPVGRGKKKQKRWGVRSKTRRCGMLTKRGKSRCVAPLRALLHQVTVVKKA